MSISPCVNRNSCTQWIPGCDVTNEGLALQTIAGCRMGPAFSRVWVHVLVQDAEVMGLVGADVQL